MRFDEINITGDFKINGVAGGENQFIGLSGGGLFWLDSSPNIEGYNVYGTNYILCNSFTYSATASGQSLRNAYASASTLSGISATNRAAILINPGVYDFDSEPLGLSLSYVDLVGLSPVASSITLKASSAPYTIQYYEGVDSGLYNLGLTGGTFLGVLGSASTYLRWDNVEVNGDCLYNESGNYSFEYLTGEFRNIQINLDAKFALSQYGINGIFENINSVGTGYFMEVFDGFILATVSNVNLKNSGSQYFKANQISGSFKNIEISTPNIMFYANTISDSIFENIKVNECGQFVEANMINVNFSDIEIRFSNNEAFKGEIEGTFNNIKLNYCDAGVFTSLSTINGTFSNIQIKRCGSAFISEGLLSGNFSEIEIEYVEAGEVFVSNNDNVSGTFNNISLDELGGLSSDPNVISGNIVQTDVNNFSVNKSLLSISGGIIMGSEISGKFTNINIGTCSNLEVFKSTYTMNGNFNDIKVKDCKNLITVVTNVSGGYLDGIYRNIVVENVGINAFITSGDANLGGTYSDIKIKDLGGRSFNVSGGSLLSGYFYNMEFENFVNAPFSNTTGDVNIKVKNVKSNDTQGIFNASGNLHGEISNVVVDKISSAFFTSGSNMDMVVDNFTIRGSNTLPAQAFSSAFSISGTYSNIYIYSEEVGIEYFNASNLSGRYENLYLGTATTIFNAAINATFKNINAASYIPTLFVGKISDSYINATGLAQPAILINDGAVIDRCRFIADAGQYSIATVALINSKISFLISNRAIDPQIRNLIDGDKNIISSAVRLEPKY